MERFTSLYRRARTVAAATWLYAGLDIWRNYGLFEACMGLCAEARPPGDPPMPAWFAVAAVIFVAPVALPLSYLCEDE
jgi:uncharacterized membrane protein YphA (DoxX/SURF4 family)